MAKSRGINKSDNSVNLPAQRILIVFLSGIGNMILFLPTLQAIRDKYPNAKIVLWAKEMVVYEMINNTGLIDEAYPYYHKKFSNLFRHAFVYLKLRKKKYDIIINTFIEQGYKVRLFIAGLRGKMKLGYRTNSLTDHCYTHLFDYNVNEHESDNHFKIAKYLDDCAIKRSPDLCLQDEEKEFARRLFAENNITKNRDIIGLHPGCSDFLAYKRWPAERFSKVIKHLCFDYGVQPVLFGGSNEENIVKIIQSELRTISGSPVFRSFLFRGVFSTSLIG